VLVQCTDAVPPAFRAAVGRAFGVEVVTLPGGATSGTTRNKLRQLEHPALDADWLVLCDCDTVFAGPLPETVFRPGLSAKLVDVGLPRLAFWTDLLGRLGLAHGVPPARRSAHGGVATYRNNCNGGLYVGDRDTWSRIGPAWRRAAEELPGLVDVPPSWEHHFDQMALGVACARLGIDVELLPSRLNFPFHLDPVAPVERAPVLLHHHQALPTGRLECSPGHAASPAVLAAADRVNRVLERVDWEAFGVPCR
jgi:hypothetical protein